ncbi:LPS export ABC transporter permease LptF [Sulfurivirga caldicuralii]|uniref:LPS export ABC transporter permease LptF n=1 Tax=Sulfurivirga caldicuralii TaxID=364032 RepID=UPI000941509D|nr:LPS export ABC transporter permease LptF [Sulfurivirga caldicuralii]
MQLIIFPIINSGPFPLRILNRYLAGELWQTFAAVLVVLLLITFGTQVSELLALAAQGRVAPELVGKLLLLKIPPALEVVLPLVVLLASQLTFGRLYQDQEMVVLASCGVPPAYFRAQVIKFAVPLMLAALAVSAFLTPWAQQQSRLLLMAQQQQSPLAAFQPGRFNDLGGEGVFYAARQDADGTLRELWLQVQTPEGSVQMSAPRGRFEWVEGRLALVLEDAWSVQGYRPGETVVTVRHMGRFEGFVPHLSVQAPPSRQEKTLAQLWHSDQPGDRALLHQRLIVPFSILVMALLGLKLAKTRPREGRFGRFFVALVVYVLYVQLLTAFQDRVAHGEAVWILGMWAVPLGFLVWLLWPERVRYRREVAA